MNRFVVTLRCENCKAITSYSYPYGTEVSRGKEGTVICLPGRRGFKATCPDCGSARIK